MARDGERTEIAPWWSDALQIYWIRRIQVTWSDWKLQGVTIQCLILVVSTELEILNSLGSNIAQTAVSEGDFEWSNFCKEQAAEKDSEYILIYIIYNYTVIYNVYKCIYIYYVQYGSIWDYIQLKYPGS